MISPHLRHSRYHHALFLAATLSTTAFVVPTASAVAPPRPGEIDAMKAAGTFEDALERARSFGNDRMNPQLLLDATERLKTQMLEGIGVTEEMRSSVTKKKTKGDKAAPSGRRNLPTTGSPRTLTLLIDFSDQQTPVAASLVNAAMYGNGNAQFFPYESLTNYYQRASYGKLNIRGTTLGWYRYSRSRASLAASIASIQSQKNAGTITAYQAALQEATLRENIVVEALQSFDPSTDFSQFDNDGDGDIDSLNVIYAGPNTGWGSFWWAYQTGAWAGPLNNLAVDGTGISGYIFEFASLHRDDDNNIIGFDPRVTIHETGHILGLPDLYDYGPQTGIGPGGGVGGLDMMHGNRGDLNSFSKWVLDWVTPTVLSTGHRFAELPPQATADDAAVIMMPGLATNGWFNDDLGTDTGYFQKWDRLEPLATSDITHHPGRVEFRGRAHLRSKAQFDPDVLGGIKVDGTWKVVSAGDTFHLATRSDGIPNPSFYHEVTSGIVFNVTNTGSLNITNRGTSLAVDQLTTGSVGPLSTGSTWRFEVFDDSDTGLAFRFTNTADPSVTATVIGRVTADTSDTNRISIYNRELSGDRSDLLDINITPGPSATDLFSEFFVVENRSGGGNDDADDFPGGSGAALNFAGGLAIWHVDARLNAARTDFAWNNQSTSHKLIRLMEADGLEQIENGRDADALDLWVPGKSFDNHSSPNSKNYAGDFTGVAVTPIRNLSGSIWTHLSFWTNPDWRRPSVTLDAPSPGASTNAASMTVTARAFDQSADGRSQPPIVELYRDDEPGAFQRWDGLPGGGSTYSTAMTMSDSRSYQLSGFAQDRDNYPLVLTSFPQVSPSRLGFVNQFPPANSFWSTATDLGGGTDLITAYNTSNNAGGPGGWSAIDETGDPAVSAQPNNRTRVWWKWTPDVPGTVEISTSGSNFDTVLALYTGGRLDTLVEIDSDDDSSEGTQSRLERLEVNAGTNYYIMVAGFNGATGRIKLNVNFSPYLAGNDNLASVLGGNYRLTGASGTVWQRNNSATVESGENALTVNTSSRTVWWRFSPASNGRLTLDTSGSDFDTYLHGFRGTAGSLGANTMATLTRVGSNDDFYGLRRTSALGFNVTAGQHYFVAVDGYSSNHSGQIKMAWKFIDRSSNSTPTISLTDPVDDRTVSKGTAVRLRATVSDSDGFIRNVQFFSDAARTQSITTVPANVESRYETEWFPAPGIYVISAVATDDEGGTDNSETVTITVPDLLIDDFAATVDDHAWVVRELAKTSGQVNSLADADALVASGSPLERTYHSHTLNLHDPDAPGPGGLLDNGTHPPHRFALDNLTPQGATTGDDNDFVTVAHCRFRVTSAGDYTFGFSSDDGARLRIFGATFASSTRLNPSNPANPAHAGSTLRFDANTGNSDTLGVVNLDPGTYALEFTTWERGGGAYAECFVAAGAKTSVDETFRPVGDPGAAIQLLGESPVPGNNDFVSARVLEGTSTRSAGHTGGATREAGESLSPGSGGSVWFRWTAPEFGLYQVDTTGSNHDTVLGVFTGSAVGSLAEVETNDDSGDSETSELTFAAVRGTTYQIAVWPYFEGSAGNYRLQLTPVLPWSTDFASLPEGTAIYGSAGLDAGTLSLTSATNDQRGSFVIPDFSGDDPVSTFDLTFDAFAGGGTDPPADGYAFAWGALPEASFGEEGPDSFGGLVVSFDTYINAGESRREAVVKWAGNQIASTAFDANTASWQNVHIRLRPGGVLDVQHGDTRLFDHLPLPGFTPPPTSGWGFGARTGGLNARHQIDNLRITLTPFEVTTLADNGDGSLRQAIAAAASPLYPGPHQVHLSPSLAGSVDLTSQISVDDPSGVLVDGSRVIPGIAISGGNSSRHFHNAAGSRLDITGISLVDGNGSGDHGGAVYNLGETRLIGTTLANNTLTAPSSSGGAIYNAPGGRLVVLHSTLTANTATARGGGIQNLGSAEIIHSTIADNSASAETSIRNQGPLTIANSISQGSIYNSSTGTITRDGANLLSHLARDGSSPPIGGPAHSTASPLLAPLGSYGGATPTFALLPGSPARDGAVSSAAFADQRGAAVVGTPDIGAYESGTHSDFDGWIWETLPASASPAQRTRGANFDGDELTNEDEFNFLTNPADYSSIFLPTVSDGVTPGTRVVTFPSAPGRRYRLQQSNSLTPGSWTDAPAAPVVGDGSPLEFVVSATPRTMFYRVVAAPIDSPL